MSLTTRIPKTGSISQGAVLVIALLFLFTLTLLGISIFETSILQTKMQQQFYNTMQLLQEK